MDLMNYATGGATRPDSFSGMVPGFRDALAQMIASAPADIQAELKVSSGFRSPERQAVLWKNALKKYGSAERARKWVAPPGNSQHNKGNAADLKFLSPRAKQWVHANAATHGLAFPLGNEPWHIELATARGGKATGNEGKGMAALVNKPAAFDPVKLGAVPVDEQEAAPVPAPVAFDPVKAGAVPFDPVAAGAQPVDEKAAGHNAPEFDPGVQGYDPATGEVTQGAGGAWDKVGAFLNSTLEGIPVAGPTVAAIPRQIAAGAVAPFSDKSFSEIENEMQGRQEQVTAENPGTALAGNLTGALGTMVPLGATALGGRALGVTGNSLRGMTAASGASSAAISGADTLARGGTLKQTGQNALVGGGIGLALPGVGVGLNALGHAGYNAIAPRLNALVRPEQEAARRVGTAMERDASNALLSPADDAAAAVNNQQLLNVDRGGETTRALARSAANTDPEARSLIEKTASDRFAAQGDRARSFIDRITHGAADDLALKDRLKDAARKQNAPAYAKAYEEGDKAVWSPELERLSSAPVVQSAMKGATSIWRNVAIADGYGSMNPGALVDRGGQLTFLNGKVPVFPNLQFWDYTKRIIDDEIGAAVRSGANQKVRTLTQIKTALTKELDKVAPSYAEARSGAARFFEAEDALDAGQKFVTQNRTLDETRKALGAMSKEERTAFAVGFASELKDAIKQSGDRTNVITKIFGSEQAREKIRLALGRKAYGEFEQFVKVENAMDMLRGAMGNSTTARQLVEMGLVGTGTSLYTGDMSQGFTAGVLYGLARKGGAKVDERVTKRVAELLLSDDPKALERAVRLASNSPKAAAAIEAIQTALASATRAIALDAGRTQTRQPLEITVTPNSAPAN